ncbi:TrmH family RNA methyltransferase [Aurantibacter sp.]|uniref:TrmH family RNA methyltransferase n=1 Tax=Aurantibacter sp. TaxID=2807103 RepID=UPI0035C80ECB
MQLNHYTTQFKERTFPITVVCDNVTNAPNVGSLFRVCDAFGVENLVFCGEHIPIGRKMTKTSRATEKVVNYNVVSDLKTEILQLKEKGYTIVCLEITSNSLAIHDYKLQPNQKIALIIGDENFGIHKDILELSDATLHINMFGQNSSMNVVQATNIALYEFTKQLQ